MERDDLTLVQATEQTVSMVEGVAVDLGSIVFRGEGNDALCSDDPSQDEVARHTYQIAVQVSEPSNTEATISRFAQRYEADGWTRGSSGDGLAVNLDRDHFGLQIEPSQEVLGRIVIVGSSPCVSVDDA